MLVLKCLNISAHSSTFRRCFSFHLIDRPPDGRTVFTRCSPAPIPGHRPLMPVFAAGPGCFYPGFRHRHGFCQAGGLRNASCAARDRRRKPPLSWMPAMVPAPAQAAQIQRVGARPEPAVRSSRPGAVRMAWASADGDDLECVGQVAEQQRTLPAELTLVVADPEHAAVFKEHKYLVLGGAEVDRRESEGHARGSRTPARR
jgi:hypothetical protein